MKIMKRNILSLSLCILAGLVLAGCKGDKSGGGETPTVDEPTALQKIVMYEAYPGMFGTSNGLQGITAQLDNIDKLGVNVLWLMPIYPQGQLKGVGSPYSVRNYTAVNENYGTLGDLKMLVEGAHERGMRVILDWVGNHTSWDNPWITEHPDWYSKDANGEIISPPGFNWNDVADLNYNNLEMRAAMLEAMKFWIAEADIDGYRCDHADGSPADFWANVNTELRKLKPDDLFMLAESGDASHLNSGFDMVYGWNFTDTLEDIFGGSKKASDLYASHTAEYAPPASADKQRLRHITNHDRNSNQSVIENYSSLEGAFSAWVIASTMGGCPLLYSSQEVGYPSKIPFFNNFQMDWSANPDYRAKYERFMAVRASSTALQASGKTMTHNVDDRVVCFVRSAGNEEILVVANTSPEAKKVALPMDFAMVDVTNLDTGENIETEKTISLEAYGYALLKKK